MKSDGHHVDHPPDKSNQGISTSIHGTQHDLGRHEVAIGDQDRGHRKEGHLRRCLCGVGAGRAVDRAGRPSGKGKTRRFAALREIQPGHRQRRC